MIIETIKMGFHSMRSNKIRTLLSMLGIIIGVGAVIAIVSIGSGTQEQITARISNLGSNIITIRQGVSRSNGRISSSAEDIFTLELGAMIKEYCPAVFRIVGTNQTSGLFIQGSENLRGTIVGTELEYLDINEYYPEKGKFFNEYDIENRTNIIVLGSELAVTLFGEENPVGQKLKFNYGKTTFLFTVIGVMEEKATGITGDLNNQAYIPISTYLTKIGNSKYVTSYFVQSFSAEDAAVAVEQIKYLLSQYYGNEDQFRLTSQDQILDTLKDVTGSMTIMLGGIAAISLLVGGIGIMNIMLVSVTERTREIGIRKALGAKRKHILGQFLVESLTLSGIGGIIGVGLGALGALGVSKFGGWPYVMTLTPVLIAFGFSLFVGIFFGIYPAVKASKLDPVKSLSYE